MTVIWTSQEAATATGGKAIGEWQVHGLSIDTRTIKEGDLFVPLKDQRDGHDFIPMALEKGAAAVMSEHELKDVPALIVDDTLKALEKMAKVKAARCTKVGVTGSVGKTSVKEMLAVVCKAAGPTHASIRSFNNHWGVPLTMASMPDDTEFAVLEMGMNHAGELTHLSGIIHPEIAVITKIAPAHLAHFAGVDDIAKAKSEIFSGVPADGICIFPGATPYTQMLRDTALAGDDNSRSVFTFGRGGADDARIISSVATAHGSLSEMKILGQTITIDLQMLGDHWVENAACVLLTARQLGIDLNIAVQVLQAMSTIKGRGEIHRLRVDDANVVLIDESYNANPESMRAAIAALGLSNGRKIAVLGDMLELGPTEKALHADVNIALKDHNIDRIITCGTLMKNLDQRLDQNNNAGWYSTSDECLTGVVNELQDGDIIMIKGSNASGMGKLVAALAKQYKMEESAHVL